MINIFDKLAILLGCSILAFSQSASTGVLFAVLIGILLSAVNSFYENKRCTLIMSAVFIACMFFNGRLIIFAPLIAYDIYIYVNKNYTMILAIVCAFFCRNISLFEIAMAGSIFIIALILAFKSTKLSLINRQMKEIRDNEVEKNIKLVADNENLLAKQDYEVYVATLKERNRIAREIHDNVGHMLTRSILQMGALMTIYKDEPMHGQLVLVKDNLDVAMNNIRQSVHDLHDESIDLEQAIKDILDEITKTHQCSFEYDIDKDIDRKYKYAIIGIVKEAVSNIMKHSSNDYVDVILREHPGMYQVIVHDYGNSPKESQINFNSGIGLKNIEDRVNSLKGHMEIKTDNGFKIFITFPKEV